MIKLARYLVRKYYPVALFRAPEDAEQTMHLAILQHAQQGGPLLTHISREMRELLRSLGYYITDGGLIREGSSLHIARVSASRANMRQSHSITQYRYAQAQRTQASLSASGKRGGDAYRVAVRERTQPKWAEAARLRALGYSLNDIAQALGYSSASGVSEALKRYRALT